MAGELLVMDSPTRSALALWRNGSGYLCGCGIFGSTPVLLGTSAIVDNAMAWFINCVVPRPGC